MTRNQTIVSTIIGIATLAGRAFGGYRGYRSYRADPKGFRKRARRLVEDAVDAYTDARERVSR